jgi:transcriptional regulator with XRE-family HTH domain
MLLGCMPLPTGHPRFDQKIIGKRIRDKRREQGYSAASLGKRVGIDESAMLKKEKGVAPFFFDELTRICDVLAAPRLFPVLEWDVAWLLERMLPPDERTLAPGTMQPDS